MTVASTARPRHATTATATSEKIFTCAEVCKAFQTLVTTNPVYEDLAPLARVTRALLDSALNPCQSTAHRYQEDEVPPRPRRLPTTAGIGAARRVLRLHRSTLETD